MPQRSDDAAFKPYCSRYDTIYTALHCTVRFVWQNRKVSKLSRVAKWLDSVITFQGRAGLPADVLRSNLYQKFDSLLVGRVTF